ncbi:MAG TPA: hypothetical protein PK765_01965 [bacterium]|nr:hypothetical protein [bacterium]
MDLSFLPPEFLLPLRMPLWVFVLVVAGALSCPWAWLSMLAAWRRHDRIRWQYVLLRREAIHRDETIRSFIDDLEYDDDADRDCA